MPRLTRWVGQAIGDVFGRSVQHGPAHGETPAGGESDWALWQRARDGHGPSAAKLVNLLTPQAYGLAIRLLGKLEDAEDAVQEAFLRLWRSAPSNQHGARLSTYFNTIVINCSRTQRAARHELATDPEALADLHDAVVHGDASAGTPTVAMGERVAGFTPGAVGARLEAAIALLPARQRMAIAMWAYADAEVPEIAQALDVNTNAAHQLLHRARETLRTYFVEKTP